MTPAMIGALMERNGGNVSAPHRPVLTKIRLSDREFVRYPDGQLCFNQETTVPSPSPRGRAHLL